MEPRHNACFLFFLPTGYFGTCWEISQTNTRQWTIKKIPQINFYVVPQSCNRVQFKSASHNWYLYLKFTSPITVTPLSKSQILTQSASDNPSQLGLHTPNDVHESVFSIILIFALILLRPWVRVLHIFRQQNIATETLKTQTSVWTFKN